MFPWINAVLYEHHVIPFLSENDVCYIRKEYDNVNARELSRSQLFHYRKETLRRNYTQRIRNEIVRSILRSALLFQDVSFLKQLCFVEKELIDAAYLMIPTPKTSLECLKWLYERVANCMSPHNYLNEHGIHNLEVYQFYMEHNLVSSAWCGFRVAIIDGDIAFLECVLERNPNIKITHLITQIASAIQDKKEHVVDWILSKSLISEKDLFFLLCQSAPETYLKQFVLKYNVRGDVILGLYSRYLTLDFAKWLHDTRGMEVTQATIYGFIETWRYDDAVALMKHCHMEDLDFTLVVHFYKFTKTDALYAYSKQFQHVVANFNLYKYLDSYEEWKWLIAHGAQHPHSILYSYIPIAQYVHSQQDWWSLIRSTVFTVSLLKRMLRHLQTHVEQRIIPPHWPREFPNHPKPTPLDIDIMQWLVRYVLNSPGMNVKIRFNETFCSYALKDDVLYPIIQRFSRVPYPDLTPSVESVD